MPGSQIPTSVTILNSLKGFQAVSLTEYNTSAAAAIAAGSMVEIAGAFFTFVSDEAINASSWTAIVTGTTAYITLTPSGTAGSQIISVAYTSTAPTWRDDHQGWYASAASNVRVIGSVYKAEATRYIPKYLYNAMQDQKQRSISVLNASVASSFSVAGPVSATSSFSVAGPVSATSSFSVAGPVSATSSLSVAGTLSVASSISASGLYYGTGIVPVNYLHGTGITLGSIFTAISTSIPVTGQSVMANGGIGITTISRVTRESSTSMRIYYNINTGGISDLVANSGAATTVTSISLAW
jgi:hypothetical protein